MGYRVDIVQFISSLFAFMAYLNACLGILIIESIALPGMGF